jgi:hypothetical protein
VSKELLMAKNIHSIQMEPGNIWTKHTKKDNSTGRKSKKAVNAG